MAVDTLYFGIFFAFFFLAYSLVPTTVSRGICLLIFNLSSYYILSPVVATIVFALALLVYAYSRLLLRSFAKTAWAALPVLALFLFLVILKNPYLHQAFAVDLHLNLETGSHFSLISALAMPLGFTYFILQAAGFLFEAKAGSASAKDMSLLQFLAASTYFLNRSAGPVARVEDISRGVQLGPSTRPANGRRNFRLLLAGLAKVGLAHFLFPAVADVRSLQELSVHATPWIVTLRFGAYLYADFSGYTDIVRAYSGFVGIVLPENFQSPFTAPNMAEYWRRWHMSLGTWLRDYFVLPLTFKLRLYLRESTSSTALMRLMALNVFLSIIIMSLWHEISAKYLFMGVANAALVILGGVRKPANRGGFARILGIALTFYLAALLRLIMLPGDLSDFFSVLYKSHQTYGGVSVSLGATLLCYVALFGIDSIKSAPIWDRRGYFFVGIGILFAAACVGALAGGYSPTAYTNF